MKDYGAWREEVFGEPYMVWHDGADFGEVARRFAADPDGTLGMLRAGIRERDALAGEAARHLEPTDEQVPAIRTMLEEEREAAYGDTRSEIAASLHALGGEPADLAQDVVRVLLGEDHWGVRLDAARRLAAFAPTAELVAALAEAVRDEDYLVRFHAANTLFHWAGRDGSIDEDDELFGLIAKDDASDGWARAAERLAAAVPR